MMASNMLYSVRYVLVVIQLLILMRISRQDLVSSLIGGVVSTLIPPTNSQDVSSTKTTYSDAELEKNFGQEGAKYNVGNSCNRKCNGTAFTCYWKFKIQLYDVLGPCGNCLTGVLADCFLPGCITANFVKRTMMAVNQQLPGPELFGCKGDRFVIDVLNLMEGFGTSVHWHGLDQKGVPWMDGVPGLTQCLIPAGGIYRYNFPVNQSGTYFYHAHHGVQRGNGISGPLIIRNIISATLNAASYDYDLPQNHVTIFDWNADLAEEMSPGYSANIDFPQSLLINGRGNFLDPATGNSTNGPLTVYYVQRGKRFLFRTISGRIHSCNTILTVDGHKLTVVATDGFDIEPFVADGISLSPGERYDFVLNVTTDPTISQFLMVIRAVGLCQRFQVQEFAKFIIVNDVMTYVKNYSDNAPLQSRPVFNAQYTNLTILNDPLANCSAPNNACIASARAKIAPKSGAENLRLTKDKVNIIKFAFDISTGQDRNDTYITVLNAAVMIPNLNGISNMHFPQPPLTQPMPNIAYCNADNKTNCAGGGGAICHCPHIVPLDLCGVYEFQLTNNITTQPRLESHPAHLHGYSFQVLRMGNIADLTNGNSPYENVTYFGPLKDTVNIPPNGYVTFRIRACNPGWWFFHCHYEYHMFAGMSASIRVGKDADIPTPPATLPKCGNYLAPVNMKSYNYN